MTTLPAGIRGRAVRLTALRRDLVLVCVDGSGVHALGRDQRTLLSAAEVAVVELAARGLSNGRIAERRRASPSTVANQLGAAYRKLGISGRRELALLLGTRASSR
jgi:DNA-binding CsgD family transcriptional regulator